MLPESWAQIPADQEIASVTTDGAYDTPKCHDPIAKRGAIAVTPPRKNAEPWKIAPLQAPWRATRPSAQRNTSAARSGDNGAATTAEAVPKPRCIVKTAGSASSGAGLRPSDRRVSGQCRRSEWTHRARHPPTKVE
jgi:hypothetical protein